MDTLTVFSFLYLAVAATAPVLGYYVFRLNAKNLLNKLFFGAVLCLAIWALSFSVIVVAPDEATAILWTRLAGVGYTLVYSMFVHFLLVLTGQGKIKRPYAFLLYLPAAVCLYHSVLSEKVAALIYYFERTPAGWVRTTPPNYVDYIFWVYYLSAIIAIPVLLFLWGKRSNVPEVKKQAKILNSAFLAAFVLGAFTDVINRPFIGLPLPQMAPIWFSIPMAALYYCISKYHFLKPAAPGSDERILLETQKDIVFKVATAALIAAGISNFLLGYFLWKNGNAVLTSTASVLLVLFGILLIRFKNSKSSYDRFEAVMLFVSAGVTPMLTVGMAPYGGQTMWAFSIMLLLCATVFNSSSMLLSASISMIFAQIYLASVTPRIAVTLDLSAYISRGVVIALIIVVAFFVHRVYVRRMRENALQTRTQAFTGSIAASFAQAHEENLSSVIQRLLNELRKHYGARATSLCPLETEYASFLGAQYCGEEEPADPDAGEESCMRGWEALWESARDGASAEDFAARSIWNITDEQLSWMKTSPFAFLPIYEGDTVVALIWLEKQKDGAPWTDDQISALPVLSGLISNGLQKLRAERRLTFMAYHDRLTGLPNRQMFHDRVEQAIHLAQRNNKLVGILLLDLDSFKSINDTMGHEGGDLLLISIGERLSGALRKSDTVARFGGDEFLVLINGVDGADDISSVADKVMRLFEKPLELFGQELFITASAGIAVFPMDGQDANTLIKHADIAMYTAKDKGKNRYAFCSNSMKESSQHRMHLSNSLYRALEKNEMEVYYQPQLNVQTQEIMGVEALLRWNHPEYGMVSPLEFITLAEQTGLITSIGSWVLETACNQVLEWEKKGLKRLNLSINLSVVQLRHTGFVREVRQIFERTGIDPAQIEFEITESTAAREPDYVVRVLNELKELGASISIDDFGTEYSSLNRLKTLPVDRIKIDTQFVHGIDKSDKDRAIAVIIISLARNLELRLTAEGVESCSQLDFLKNKNCDEVQGFYFYKPMPAGEMEGVLTGDGGRYFS